MKKYLINFLAFCLLFIVIDVLFGFVGDAVRDHIREGANQTSRENYAIRTANPKLLVLGSSRAAHHYSTKILEDSFRIEVYNAGREGHGLLYSSCIFDAISSRHNVKYAILDITPGALYKLDRIGTLKPYYHVTSLINRTIDERNALEKYRMLSNFYRYNLEFFKILKSSYFPVAPDSLNGYVPLSSGTRKLELKHSTLGVGMLNVYMIDRLKEILVMSKKRNVKLIVAISPFYGIIDKNEPCITKIKNVCTDVGVPFINYSQNQYFLIHPNMFTDDIHLCKIGAEVYTKMIIKDLRRYKFIPKNE